MTAFKPFPYFAAKAELVRLLDDSLSAEFKGKANSIIDLHLQLDTLAMPAMSEQDEGYIQQMIINGVSLDDIRKSLVLENTTIKKGIFRVLVRTHLNRSGINHLSQGSKRKTLSPRILNFTDSIDLNENVSNLILNIIPRWLEFVKSNRDISKPALFCDEKAIVTLTKLNDALQSGFIQLFDSKNVCKFTAPSLCQKLKKHYSENESQIDLGWCRIVLGVISGLVYLNHRNWDHFIQASNSNLSYESINKLIVEARSMVAEYGYALAGSFFADLGGSCFVKDDTHVRGCVEALSKEYNTPEKRVEYVINSASKLSIQPRLIDKLMYLAGSGNYYLIGLKAKNSQHIKNEFISFLKLFKN